MTKIVMPLPARNTWLVKSIIVVVVEEVVVVVIMIALMTTALEVALVTSPNGMASELHSTQK